MGYNADNDVNVNMNNNDKEKDKKTELNKDEVEKTALDFNIPLPENYSISDNIEFLPTTCHNC